MLSALVLAVTILTGPPSPDLALVKTTHVVFNPHEVAQEVVCSRTSGEISTYLLLDAKDSEGEVAPAAYYHEILTCR
jgi:hypothetical protein